MERSLNDLLENGLNANEKLRHLVVGPNRQRLGKSMFWEFSEGSKTRDNALYTLYGCAPTHYVHKMEIPRYDLKQLYLGCRDTTEQVFIENFMWDRKQWDKLTTTGPLKDIIEGWRKELLSQEQARMINVIVTDALEYVSPTKTTRAKYLLDKVLKVPTIRSAKGAKSTKEQEKENNVMKQILEEVQEASQSPSVIKLRK